MATKHKSPSKERNIRRKVRVRPVKKSFLIICEGVNTEPDGALPQIIENAHCLATWAETYRKNQEILRGLQLTTRP